MMLARRFSTLWLLIAVAHATSAAAQTEPPPSRRKPLLDRLDGLLVLPLLDWHMAGGELPRGEAAALDDRQLAAERGRKRDRRRIFTAARNRNHGGERAQHRGHPR